MLDNLTAICLQGSLVSGHAEGRLGQCLRTGTLSCCSFQGKMANNLEDNMTISSKAKEAHCSAYA